MARDVNEISGIIVDATIKVHRVLGPRLLESVYMAALAIELRSRGLKLGLLLNFGMTFMKEGIFRHVEGLE